MMKVVRNSARLTTYAAAKIGMRQRDNVLGHNHNLDYFQKGHVQQGGFSEFCPAEFIKLPGVVSIIRNKTWS